MSAPYRLRRHRPWRTAIVTALVVIILGLTGWSLYWLGLRHGGFYARSAQATETHLRLRVEELRHRIEKLADRSAVLERAQRIDEQAVARLRNVIEARENRIAELEEELAFYRNLVSPSQTQPGLRVRRARLEPVPGTARSFRYEVVLTQLNSDDRYVSGRVDLKLEGRRDGEPATLGLEELTGGEGDPAPGFRFKYFQRIRGRIDLPEAFEPVRVRLRVAPSGGRLEAVDETYAWSTVLSGGS